jgi:hypothetical protein
VGLLAPTPFCMEACCCAIVVPFLTCSDKPLAATRESLRSNMDDLLEYISQVDIRIALPIGLLHSLCLGWMIGHRLEANAVWTNEPIENNGRTGILGILIAV